MLNSMFNSCLITDELSLTQQYPLYHYNDTFYGFPMYMITLQYNIRKIFS